MLRIINSDIEISNSVILKDLNRITNQIFKLLPLREEGGEWKSPLENLIVEICGLNDTFEELDFLILLTKMKGLMTLDKEEDFSTFRKNIFECLGLLTKVKQWLESMT